MNVNVWVLNEWQFVCVSVCVNEWWRNHFVLQEKANEALARAIFISGAPLNVVEHPLWKEFFETLRPSFVPPTRRVLSSSMLDAEYERTKTQLKATIQNTKFLNLQCDGWTNIRNESIMNFIITIPEPVFVDFLPTGSNKHTGEFIAQEIIKILDQFGPEKFFVIVGDNAKNMSAAFKIVRSTEGYKHIVSIGCIVHLMHLICKDIIDCNKVHKCVVNANVIVKSIKRSHRLTAIFIEKQKEKGCTKTLKLAGTTRWGSHLFCLQSLLGKFTPTFALNNW